VRSYEVLVILSEELDADRLKAAVARVVGEIEKAGGRSGEPRWLGRHAFARPLRRRKSGEYVALPFTLDPEKVAPLESRLKLDDDIFRFQIVRMEEQVGSAARPTAESAGKEA